VAIWLLPVIAPFAQIAGCKACRRAEVSLEAEDPHSSSGADPDPTVFKWFIGMGDISEHALLKDDVIWLAGDRHMVRLDPDGSVRRIPVPNRLGTIWIADDKTIMELLPDGVTTITRVLRPEEDLAYLHQIAHGPDDDIYVLWGLQYGDDKYQIGVWDEDDMRLRNAGIVPSHPPVDIAWAIEHRVLWYVSDEGALNTISEDGKETNLGGDYLLIVPVDKGVSVIGYRSDEDIEKWTLGEHGQAIKKWKRDWSSELPPIGAGPSGTLLSYLEGTCVRQGHISINAGGGESVPVLDGWIVYTSVQDDVLIITELLEDSDDGQERFGVRLMDTANLISRIPEHPAGINVDWQSF